ncbi:hypothetical protein JW879_08100 [candidate division WOR-3 bacterium]|nr:hypothetical protein [candidate division WOR-3 bacterium]
MKKVLVVFVCILFSFAGLASEDNQGTYDIPNISSTESQPISQILENLSTYEKSNAVIDIEYNEENMEQADLIEETWNRGDYEEAIESLKRATELENAALGIQWKEPVKTPLSRWAGDVRVGTVDSITDIDFDVDNSNGNLLAVLLYQYNDTYYRFTINMSSDTGKTWTETYLWTASVDNEFYIDAAVYNGYFYVAYTNLDNQVGRIRRFSTSDGTSDNAYAYLTVINEGVVLREIVLTSDADSPTSQYLFFLALMENDSMRLYFSNPTATSWTRTVNFNVPNVDRGIDACWAAPNKLWASYIGTDNELYFIGGWSSWTTYPTSADLGTNGFYVTSISAYGDTVIIVYPFPTSPTHEVRYYITTNNGSNWGVGTILSASNTASWVNDVTARGGDGIGAVYQTTGLSAEGIYRHRSYSSSLWTPPVSFADNVTRANIKPCIERIADGIYGILYVNYPTTEEMAWFDRSDWLTPDGLSLSPDGETIEFGDTLELTAYLEKDASGVEGEELNFAVITGDGSLDPTSGVTDASGEVQTDFIAGSTEETVTVEVMWVSYNLLDTLTATVDIEVIAGSTADGLSLSPDGETIEFGATLALTAYLEKDGSPVAGEELNFAVITGDGSLDPTSGVTDGAGEVYTEFTAGSTEENVTVQTMWVSANLLDTLNTTVDIEVVAEGIEEIPAVSGISAAFGSGEILCAVAEEGEVTVKIYDKLGREEGTLLNGKVKRGCYPLSLKELNLPSDIYFVEMLGPGINTKIKVTLIN